MIIIIYNYLDAQGIETKHVLFVYYYISPSYIQPFLFDDDCRDYPEDFTKVLQ